MRVELLKGFMGGKYQDIQLREANCSLLRFVKGCVADGSEDKVLEFVNFYPQQGAVLRKMFLCTSLVKHITKQSLNT